MNRPMEPVPARAADRCPPAARAGTVVVSSVSSDAHTWNLVFLQLLIEELGYTVLNLGPCVPDDLLIEECCRIDPAMVVISSVNGHGREEGMRLIDRLRARPELAATPVVIGGKLGIDHEAAAGQTDALLDAGFDAVFADGRGAADFRTMLASMAPRAGELAGSGDRT
ncbi:cobalamin B12-binding domain-containing protein [Streptomyces asiaticus]